MAQGKLVKNLQKLIHNIVCMECEQILPLVRKSKKVSQKSLLALVSKKFHQQASPAKPSKLCTSL